MVFNLALLQLTSFQSSLAAHQLLTPASFPPVLVRPSTHLPQPGKIQDDDGAPSCPDSLGELSVDGDFRGDDDRVRLHFQSKNFELWYFCYGLSIYDEHFNNPFSNSILQVIFLQLSEL